MIGRLNHVAIAVPDLEAAADQYRTALGANVGEPQDEPDHGVTVIFIELPNTKIELLYPLGENSPIQGFLDKNPSGGIHHVCYEVDDILAARDHLKSTGARVLGDAVVSISGRSLRSLDITDRDNPRLLSELTLAWPADIVHRVGDTLIQLERGPGYWWYGTPESPARLHVSPVADPDELLKSIELPGGRVAGSFLHGDCLFVAQTQMSSEQIGEELIDALKSYQQ